MNKYKLTRFLLVSFIISLSVLFILLVVAWYEQHPQQMEVHSNEVVCPVPIHIHCDCNVTVVCEGCCECPQEATPTSTEVGNLTPTNTPFTLAPTWTPTESNTPTTSRTPTSILPTTTKTILLNTPTRTTIPPTTTPSPVDTRTPVPTHTNTPIPTSTIPPTVATSTGTSVPTNTITPSSTSTPSLTSTPQPPTPTSTHELCVCYQWVCHKLGGGHGYMNFAARRLCHEQRWKNYCCWSDGCVRAHMRHGDKLGRCEAHGITPAEPDEWNKEGCP